MAPNAPKPDALASLPDETISVDGNSIECYVARYSDKDFKTRRNDLSENTALRIENPRMAVCKSLSQREALDRHRVTRMYSN